MKYTIDTLNPPARQLVEQYSYFLLDFDNTLYNENHYLFGAYKNIADYLARRYAISANAVEDFLVTTFTRHGRTNLFNQCCTQYGINETEVPEMLKLLRTYRPASLLSLYPAMEQLLHVLQQQHKWVGVVTNGNVQQQQNKVACVQWNETDRQIVFVYANALQPKPHPAAYTHLSNQYGLTAAQTVMIGDSETDEQFAQNSGIGFVNVSTILQAIQ